jgi:alpha-2-macroglobulin
MTAYVVWGLTLARDAGVQIKTDALERGGAFLDKEIVEEEANYDQQSWMLSQTVGGQRSAVPPLGGWA